MTHVFPSVFVSFRTYIHLQHEVTSTALYHVKASAVLPLLWFYHARRVSGISFNQGYVRAECAQVYPVRGAEILGREPSPQFSRNLTEQQIGAEEQSNPEIGIGEKALEPIRQIGLLSRPGRDPVLFSSWNSKASLLDGYRFELENILFSFNLCLQYRCTTRRSWANWNCWG
jgi:hypothetical protein